MDELGTIKELCGILRDFGQQMQAMAGRIGELERALNFKEEKRKSFEDSVMEGARRLYEASHGEEDARFFDSLQLGEKFKKPEKLMRMAGVPVPYKDRKIEARFQVELGKFPFLEMSLAKSMIKESDRSILDDLTPSWLDGSIEQPLVKVGDDRIGIVESKDLADERRKRGECPVCGKSGVWAGMGCRCPDGHGTFIG